MSGLNFKMRKIDNGYEARVFIGGFNFGSIGPTPAQALNGAVGLANNLVGLLEENPELKAVLPPQAHAALMAIKIASAAAKSGQLKAVAKKIPKAAATVAAVLRSIL